MSLSLLEAQQRFAEWRSQKKKPREAIPQELWNVAVELTKIHSQSKVAKALGLNNSALSSKRKQQPTSSAVRSSSPTKPNFIEVSSSPHRTRMICTRIEIERCDGHRLRLFSSPDHPFGVLEVIEHFTQESHAATQCAESHLFSR